jgi:predicted dithiol-disulfide oxidoreductase (DUF899 family)
MSTKTNTMIENELASTMDELSACRKKINDLQRKLSHDVTVDYHFLDGDGNEISLASLFGDKDDLIVVHNMGKGCAYCTLWADGFNGVFHHLENRTSFAVVSPDKPEIMKSFADGRGWKFRILSNAGGTFSKDMGYENDKGGPLPGMSTFHRDADGNISRVAHAPFGPGDDFCAVWHMFDMLKDGQNSWQPKFDY